MKRRRHKIRPGDYVFDMRTGERGIIADIQYTHDRYQVENKSGWQYGIVGLLIIP